MQPEYPNSGSSRSKPTSQAVIDYKWLRLKFLLSKAFGHGVDPIEMFEHFDTDHSGEISVAELENGLDRLGISLTGPELVALLVRSMQTQRKTHHI